MPFNIELTKPTVLVMFSGGVDSLGALYKIMTDSTYSSYDIHVHHVNLINSENRAEPEAIAVKAILEELSKMPTLPKLGYSESTFELPSCGKGVVRDAYLINFISGVLCDRLPLIQKVVLGVNLTDIQSFANDMTVVNKAVELFSLFSDRKLKVYPVRDMTKKEIYDFLPENLRKLVWFCRRPAKVGDKFIQCGGCSACQQINGIQRVV
jgi:7-cyano-7-deazaguanine synthase in queuosine biosynthesis